MLFPKYRGLGRTTLCTVYAVIRAAKGIMEGNRGVASWNSCSNVVLIAVVGLSLSACGGSGTTAPSPAIVAPTTSPPPSNPEPNPTDVASFKTSEFNRSWGLDAINAAEAYALGATGKDVVIAVVDFNIDLSDTELNLHAASVVADPENVAIYEAQFGEPVTDNPHGNAVATVAAGQKNDSGIHGVAFDATVLAVDFFSGVNSRQVLDNNVLVTVSDPWTYAFDQGARIFNKSFGFDEDDIIEDLPIVDVAYTIEFDTTAVALGGLVVSSAGNNSDAEPSLSNLEALNRLARSGLLNGGPGAYIIAGSVDEDLRLSSFSDAAGTGESRFHYLVAPGGQVSFPWINGIVIGNGTSFSAPHISGAAAVIMSQWPSLTAREVADIMFKTATDLGAPGIDAVYGNGLLNLEAALQPVGEAKITVQGAPTQSVTDAAIHLGAAFGDAKSLSLALSRVMILDDFDRDFFIDASRLVSSNQGRSNIESRFNARRNWQSASLGFSSAGQLNYSLNRDPYSIPAFALAGQAKEDFIPEVDAVFEFAGHTGNSKWVIGTGRSLSSALAREPYARAVNSGFSLTGANDPAVPLGNGAYMAFNNPVAENTELWFGVSQSKSQGQNFHSVETLQQDSKTTAMAMRIDHYFGKQRLSTEIGVSLEDNSLLGGRSAGGLRFGAGATTSWITVASGWQLTKNITLESAATLAVTESNSVAASLIDDMGMITSSAFQLKAAMTDALVTGDNFTLTLNQPLRVENASAMFSTGSTLNSETGAVQFNSTHVSLAPAGREIAVEAGYRVTFSGWNLEANAAFRRDAGHFDGQRDALFAFNINRGF